MASWYERDPRRLALESESLRRSFPRLSIKSSNGTLLVTGSLLTAYGKSYDVWVVFPPNYPYDAPQPYTTTALKQGCPHRYNDGRLCVFLPGEWTPNNTISVMIGWVAKWLHSYDAWCQTGSWPGRQHG